LVEGQLARRQLGLCGSRWRGDEHRVVPPVLALAVAASARQERSSFAPLIKVLEERARGHCEDVGNIARGTPEPLAVSEEKGWGRYGGPSLLVYSASLLTSVVVLA
jgi:hypothetical protein